MWVSKSFGAHNCLLVMSEKRKSSVNIRKAFCTLLRDLLKAFDCLSHELIIVKLNAYGFRLSFQKLMQIIVKSTNLIVLGRKYFSVCSKHLYLVRFYLTFS